MHVWLFSFLCAVAAAAGVEAPGSPLDQQLIAAMWRGDPAEIRGLLERGADANARSDQGDTPLMMVAIFADNPDGRVVELIELLLAHKADPNAAGTYGRTPLSAMIEYRRVPAARALIRGGAKVDAMPAKSDAMSRNTALMRACESGLEAAVDMLLEEGADPAVADGYGQTALSHALGKHPAIVRKLIAKGGKRLAGELRRAAEVGDAEAVTLLLEAGADPDTTEKDRETAVQLAAGKGHAAIVTALLAKGAAADGALLAAAREGHADTVRAMLAAKVDPDSGGSRGAALLAAFEKGRPEIARLLIEAGADLEDRYSGNWRALHVAAAKGDLETVKLMVARKARLDWPDGFEGRTPLIEAAAAGHLEVVRALLDAGAKIDLANTPGPPGCVGGPALVGAPLAWAEKGGHAAVAKLLTERGAKPK